MSVAQVISEVEATGAKFRLEGSEIRISFTVLAQRDKLSRHITYLRAHRDEVTVYLRAQANVPAMPPGVHLFEWKLKQPPIAIETCEVVVNTALFAKSTFEQLRIAIANPKRWMGWSVPELVERLSRVGVLVRPENSESKVLDK